MTAPLDPYSELASNLDANVTEHVPAQGRELTPTQSVSEIDRTTYGIRIIVREHVGLAEDIHPRRVRLPNPSDITIHRDTEPGHVSLERLDEFHRKRVQARCLGSVHEIAIARRTQKKAVHQIAHRLAISDRQGRAVNDGALKLKPYLYFRHQLRQLGQRVRLRHRPVSVRLQ